MGQPIQSTVDTVVRATDTILDQGVIGALLILAIIIIGVLAWFLRKSHNKFTDYLEKQVDKNK